MALAELVLRHDVLTNRPTATTANKGVYFYATDTLQLFRSNGTSWDDESNRRMTLLELTNGSAPSTPSSGITRVYVKSSDKLLYFMDDGGNERKLITNASQGANKVLASPNGSSGAPDFRALVAADIPNLPASKITTGTFADARLALMTTNQSANLVLAGPASGSAAAPGFRALVKADLPQLVNTADQGYIYLPCIYQPENVSAIGFSPTSANTVRVHQIVVPFACVLSKFVVNITTNNPGSTVDVGLYDTSGSLVAHTAGISGTATGAISGAVTGGIVSGGLLILTPGVYFYAWTGSDTTVAGSMIPGAAGYNALLNLNTNKKSGTAANTATAGVLPATLGTITAATVNMILALAER